MDKQQISYDVILKIELLAHYDMVITIFMIKHYGVNLGSYSTANAGGRVVR